MDIAREVADRLLESGIAGTGEQNRNGFIAVSRCIMVRARRITVEAVRLGRIIARLRQQRGWTLIKLAQRSGMTPQYLRLVERGENLPSLSTLIELSDVLGADPAEIVREIAAARNPRPAESPG
ncbi:MAG TPA: helix-turn-helix transcriptional regulator [Thermoanaerobaculia bacterium]|jgi:ribosome-binding protein aMBF1 (putative translation factor)